MVTSWKRALVRCRTTASFARGHKNHIADEKKKKTVCFLVQISLEDILAFLIRKREYFPGTSLQAS